MSQHNGTDFIKIEGYYIFCFFCDVPRYVQANSGTVTPYNETRLLSFQFENIALRDHLTSAPPALKLMEKTTSLPAEQEMCIFSIRLSEYAANITPQKISLLSLKLWILTIF